ncbi:unnamed protein product [Gordionus sp. m RMFG-2023]
MIFGHASSAHLFLVVPPSSTQPAPPHIHTVDPLYFPMITLISLSVLFSTPVFFSLSFRYAYIEPIGALAPRSCSTVYYPPASSEDSLCRFNLVPCSLHDPYSLHGNCILTFLHRCRSLHWANPCNPAYLGITIRCTS